MKLFFLGLLMIFGILSILLVGVPASFAQQNMCPSCVEILPGDIEVYQKLFPLIAWTDSQVYDHDSVVKISGHLKPENNVAPILVVVTSPIGNIVSVEQISPAPNGDFSLSLNTKSPLWKQDGTYIVKIQSGSDSRQFKTKFILDSSIGDVSKCASKEITITASDSEVYCLPFKFSKGTIPKTSGTLDIGSKTLSLKITGTVADSIILDIPRSILDSKSPSGSDSEFIVMSDGKIISFQQLESDADSRQVKIEYSPASSGSYQITGTHVIPEFGTIASLVLVGSIVSVLFLSGSFSNRFVKF